MRLSYHVFIAWQRSKLSLRHLLLGENWSELQRRAFRTGLGCGRVVAMEQLLY
jgi:hypothetical protein